MAKILMIESDASVRNQMKIALESEGYQVEETGEGKTAVDSVRQYCPDVIVLSVELSQGQNGYILCNRLRKDEELKDIPIVLTGNPDGFAAHAKLKAKANQYVPKPINSQLLLTSVSRCLPATDTPDLVGEESADDNSLGELVLLDADESTQIQPPFTEPMDVTFEMDSATSAIEPDLVPEVALDTDPGYSSFELEGLQGGAPVADLNAERDKEITDLKKQVSELSAELTRRETQMKALAQRTDALAAEKKHLEPQVAQLQIELDALKLEHETFVKHAEERTTAGDQLERLQAQSQTDQRNREKLRKALSIALQLLGEPSPPQGIS